MQHQCAPCVCARPRPCITSPPSRLQLAPLAAAFANFIELRTDAFKVAYELRRPRYRGAKDIGAWSGVLRFLSWLSLVTNTLLIAFTSQGIREELLIPMMVPAACDASSDPFFISDMAKAGKSAVTA